nr:unnamed protein product [Spirometra erinaceieuropaei]
MGIADATAADVESEEEDGSGGLGVRSMLIVGVEDEAELDEETAAGVVRYIPARDQVLPSQLQYPSEMIESSRLLLVHRPSLRSIKQRRYDDHLAHLQFLVQLKTVTIPNCVLKTTEGLAGLGNPVGHFLVDFGAAAEGAAQIREIVRHLQLGSVQIDLLRIVGSIGWRLIHDHRLLRVDDQAEVLTDGGGGEEVHALLHVPFEGGVGNAVIDEEKLVDGSCGHATGRASTDV